MKGERELEAFFERLPKVDSAVLFLDYDGTLAPFRADRDAAVPYPGVIEPLSRILSAGRTRVVMVSGRPAGEVARLLDLKPHPEIWGAHGCERVMQDGRSESVELAPEIEAGLERVWALIQREKLDGRADRKASGVAVHVRGLPSKEADRVVKRALSVLLPIAEESGLLVSEFDGGVELRAPGVTKARAVSTVLSETSGTAAVAYLGDDHTDEDAFAQIAGRGLSILVRGEYRRSRAEVWLRPPKELVDFLQRWARERGKEVRA
jgi:trehalose 6-phosphate phosphatase